MLNNPFLSPEQNMVVAQNAQLCRENGFAVLFARNLLNIASELPQTQQEYLDQHDKQSVANTHDQSTTIREMVLDENPFFVFALNSRELFPDCRISAFRISTQNIRALGKIVIPINAEFCLKGNPYLGQDDSFVHTVENFARECFDRQLTAKILC